MGRDLEKRIIKLLKLKQAIDFLDLWLLRRIRIETQTSPELNVLLIREELDVFSETLHWVMQWRIWFDNLWTTSDKMMMGRPVSGQMSVILLSLVETHQVVVTWVMVEHNNCHDLLRARNVYGSPWLLSQYNSCHLI